MAILDFYLGAGSPGGFAGYFSRLCDVESGLNTTLIKAGPGCGKSGLMRKISQNLVDNGLIVENIHCSSDPDSLDGVVCAEKNFAIIDATTPHVVEPIYPCAVEKILPFFHLLDDEYLFSNRDEIINLFEKNSCFHDRATRYITSAGTLMQDSMRVLSFCVNMAKLDAFCSRFISNRLKTHNPGKGKEHQRLLSAVTPKGIVFYGDTIKKIAKNIVVIDDDIGFISKHILSKVRSAALAMGYDIYSCYCPMFPYEKLDHIIIPSLSLAIVTRNRYLNFDYGEVEVIKSSRFIFPERLRERKKRLKFNRSITTELLVQAQSMLASAKEVHDLIEEYYIKAMDFSGIDKLYEKVRSQLYS